MIRLGARKEGTLYSVATTKGQNLILFSLQVNCVRCRIVSRLHLPSPVSGVSGLVSAQLRVC
jgi:hypothetical protein